MDDDNLASYNRVEIVALAIGLAMRDIWVTQFPENFSGIPVHVTNSPFEFREYEQLSYDAKTLLDGYEDLFVSYILLIICSISDEIDRLTQIAKAYPEKPPRNKTTAEPNKQHGQQPRGR